MSMTCLRQQGFTMMELLIAILVLSVGFLGLASLQSTGLKHNTSAYHRTLAIELAQDMADRIRANPIATGNGNYDNVTAGGYPDCLSGSGCATETAAAQADATQWYAALAAQLPAGTGDVTATAVAGGAARRFTIRVMWDDERRGVTGKGCSGNPAVDLTCFTLEFID